MYMYIYKNTTILTVVTIINGTSQVATLTEIKAGSSSFPRSAHGIAEHEIFDGTDRERNDESTMPPTDAV